MARDVDWVQMRADAFWTGGVPGHWPTGVTPLTSNGLLLFGLDDRRQLYWNGAPIEVRKLISLTTWQRIGAVLITLSTVAGATVQVWTFLIARGWL